MPRRQVTGNDIPEEQALFTEAWNFLKDNYYLRQESPSEEWEQCTGEYSKLCSKGAKPETKQLAQGLAHTVFKYIEIRSNGG